MKKKLAIAVIVITAAVAAILTLLPPKPDMKGKIIDITVLSVSEDITHYLLTVDGGEYGYGESVYVKITENTEVKNADGKNFLAESFIEGDMIEVYFVKSTADDKIITAKKAVFEYHVEE